MVFSLLARVVACVCLNSVLCAPAMGEPDQIWRGAVTVAPGNEIAMTIRVVQTEDGEDCTLSIPAQAIDEVSVIDLVHTESELSFTLALRGLPEELRPSFRLDFTADGGLTGQMLQGGMEFPAKFEATDEETLRAETAKRRPQTPIGPFPYRTEEIVVPVVAQGSSHTLAGTLTLPGKEEFGEGPYPAVVFITGSGAQDRDETIFEHKPFAVIADHLARSGIASLRCDDRGVFGSSGDAVKATTYDFVDDAKAQLEVLFEDSRVGPIGVIGHSEGGVVGPMLAASDDRVRFVVMLAGTGVPGLDILIEQTAALLEASGLDEDLVAKAKVLQTEVLTRFSEGESIEALKDSMGELIRIQSGMELSDELLAPAVEQASVQLDYPWFRAFVRLDPREALQKVSQPVLVLNGDKDLQVLSWQNIPEIKKALDKNPDVTVRVFEGLNHMFQKCETGSVAEYASITTTIEPEVLGVVSDWILERFGG